MKISPIRLAAAKHARQCLIWLSWILTCGFLSTSFAEIITPAWEKLAETPFTHFDQDNGLPHQLVTAIVQDQEGFLWVGTQGGLARWDGYRFRHYMANAAQPNALADDAIQVLHRDQRGQLWIGFTSNGLARYRPGQDDFLNLADGKLSNPSVYAISDDGQGGLWLGTHGGLNHLDADGQKVRVWHHQEREPLSLPHDRVQALLRDNQGRLWVGTARGLVRKEGEHFKPLILQAGSTLQPDIRALWQAADGSIWVGTSGAGAFMLDARSLQVTPIKAPPAFNSSMINSISAPNPREIWLGSFGAGVLVVERSNLQTRIIQHDPALRSSLGDNSIQYMYTDRSGLLWVAHQRGMSRHDPNQAGLLNLSGNRNGGKISDRDVWSVLALPNGMLWLGLGNQGIDFLHPVHGVSGGLRPQEGQSNSLPSALVMHMLQDGEDIYIGTNRGLYRARQDGQNLEFLPLPPRKPSASIKALLMQEQGLLIGGSDGVWLLPRPGPGQRIKADSAVKPADFSDKLGDERTTKLLQDSNGVLWIGTWHGLQRYDNRSQSMQRFLPDKARPGALAQGYITSLLRDRQGRIWVGTSGGGLHLWLGGDQFRRFELQHGLPNLLINQILEDRDGNIWVSTDGGLAKVDGKSLQVQALRRADGVQFPTYWSNSGSVGLHGELFFGAAGGLSVVKPGQIKTWEYQPPLAITEVQAGGKMLASSPFNNRDGSRPTIQVPAGNNSLSVEFAALDFSAPEKNRYAYQLEGYDSKWQETDARHRLASYTNLPPGNYLLHLRGSNRNGLWNPQQLTLNVEVLPDWYETWWFRLILFLSGACAVFALIHIRTSFLRQQKQALAAIVTRRTEELQQQQIAMLQSNAELQRANQELALSATSLRELGDIGREITASLELDAVFAALHRHVRHLLDAPTLSIYRTDPEQNRLHYVFGREDEKVLPATSIPLNNPHSNAARAARERREVLLELEEGQENPNPIPGTRNMLTLLFAPLIVDQHLLGVMSIQSDHAHAYGERERMIFRTLCAYGAIALENGNAYRQLQETQQRLVEQEKLAALGALVAGVAHELNTPLGNGMMMASALQQNLEHLLHSLRSSHLSKHVLDTQLRDAQMACEVLMRNLRTSAQLVNSFKQVAVDRTSAQRRVFDLRQTSAEVVATMSSKIRAQGHDIALNIAPDIIMDSFPGPYGQVLEQLINNALLHAFEGREDGKIRLEARLLSGERVEITCGDDGTGIPEEHRKHIFDPFFTTKMGQGGQGLGLSVCYSIVHTLLGGTIRVESCLGKGTCFVMDLPMVAREDGGQKV